MESTPFWQTKTRSHPNEEPAQEQIAPSLSHEAGRTLEVQTNATKRPTGNLIKSPLLQREGGTQPTQNGQPEGWFHLQKILNKNKIIAEQSTIELRSVTSLGAIQQAKGPSIEDINTQRIPIMTQMQTPVPSTPPLSNIMLRSELEIIETLELPRMRPQEEQPTHRLKAVAGHSIQSQSHLTRGKALLLISVLCMILLQALIPSYQQIFGSQGWAYVLGGPSGQKTDLLGDLNNQLHSNKITPQQYINDIIQKMTLDQKLGQMMLVQFVGQDFSLDLSTMITQYNVGSVLLLAGNHNISSKNQLTSLTQQMQHSSTLPMIVSLDQEGGYVDRLADLDGPRPSAADIGATGDPAQATAAGKQDAQDLSQYGINLQLAPVVDIGTPYSTEEQQARTFGNDADTVTKMAGAYLQGLQQGGNVIGTLKHFPDLGSSTVDPHIGLPILTHTLDQLNNIDWAPYRSLINQGLAHAIMVTHEVVTAIDNTTPASLSNKIVTGILRDQLGFQGVIMTDSLTMEGISAYYTTKQAAVLAVEAGSDIIMGADTPSTVATMLQGIKEAINTGDISQQRIDQSVYRILMLKYQMGLLKLPTK